MIQDREIGPQAVEYLNLLESKGRKDSTVNCYRNSLKQCFRCLRNGGRETDAEAITTDDIHYLWDHLGVKEEVRIAYLRDLSRFVEHYTGRNVVKMADILRNREMRERVFIERWQYFILVDNADPFQRIVLMLGGLMGLRRGEMIGIMDRDILDGVILIHGKGHGRNGLMVRAYMPKTVEEEIERYRRWKEETMPDSGDGYLLQTRSKTGTRTRATPQQVSGSIMKLGQDCGIKVTTHSLRRLFATTLYYEVEADIQTVRSLMRHASVDTTLKCYIDADDSRERNAMHEVEDSLNGKTAQKKRRRRRAPSRERWEQPVKNVAAQGRGAPSNRLGAEGRWYGPRPPYRPSDPIRRLSRAWECAPKCACRCVVGRCIAMF